MAWKDHPYSAEGYLYLLQPAVVMKARVNLASASYPLASIPFDGVTAGSFGAVEMGMTVLIGSTDGAWDRGRIYVRGDADQVCGDSANLNIGYCSRGSSAGEVDLIDDSYLTVLDTFEVWKRASRFIDGTGIRKDYALTAADPLPIAHLGGAGGLASMGFVSGGVLTLAFDSSGSRVTAPGEALAATDWDVKDGTITVGSDTSAAITATFPAGRRWIKLVKTQSNAVISLPRRHLVVALSAASDTLLTVHKARVRLTPEGVSFSCDLRQRLDPALYPPGTVAIWLVQERYAGVAGSITGYEVKFAGYVESLRSFGQGTREGWERGSTISATDVAGRSAGLRCLPSTMARESSPANPNQLAEATLDRYAWWLLAWHTSVPMLADVHWSGETHPFTSFSVPGITNFYKAPDALCRASAKRLTMDSRGRLWMLDDPLRLEPDARTSTVLQSLLPIDIARIDRVAKPFPTVGVLRATATLESTADASTFDADNEPQPDLHAVAPGDVEGQGTGSEQNDVPWLVPSATVLYQRVGHDLKRRNLGEESLKILLAHGGDGGIEPALMSWVEVTTDSDTVGWTDMPLTAERCLVVATEFEFDDQAQTMRQTITVERETIGTPGVYDPIAGTDTRLPGYAPVPRPTGEIPQQVLAFAAGEAKCTLFADITLGVGAASVLARNTGLSGIVTAYYSDPFEFDAGFAFGAGGVDNAPHLGNGFTTWTHLHSLTDVFGGGATAVVWALGSHMVEGWGMAQGDNGYYAVTHDGWVTFTTYAGSYNAMQLAPHSPNTLIGVVQRGIVLGVHYPYVEYFVSTDGGASFASFWSNYPPADINTFSNNNSWLGLEIPYQRPSSVGGGNNTFDAAMVIREVGSFRNGGFTYGDYWESTNKATSFTVLIDQAAGDPDAYLYGNSSAFGMASSHTWDADVSIWGHFDVSPQQLSAVISLDHGATIHSNTVLFAAIADDYPTLRFNGWPVIGTDDPAIGYWIAYCGSLVGADRGGIQVTGDNGLNWTELVDPSWSSKNCNYAEYRLVVDIQ